MDKIAKTSSAALAPQRQRVSRLQQAQQAAQWLASQQSLLTQIRPKLLVWYRVHARDLPWRRRRDPYAIWVSEVMLQQTQVETVKRYYNDFLGAFPNLQALAAATEAQVLSAWSGLGYYRRARLLHQGAQEAVTRHGGEVPRSAAARLALSGVGKYTAGAIGSIAFGLPEPIVDGNVARVLSRLFGLQARLGSAASETKLWAIAAALVVGEDPASLNQALMEFGALQCTVAKPQCARCPLQAHCQAYTHGLVAKLPVPRERKAPKVLHCVAVIAQSASGAAAWSRAAEAQAACWLLRSPAALFGGLWLPPWLEIAADAAAPHKVLAHAGLRATAVESVASATVEHVLTHRRLRFAVYRATGVSAVDPSQPSLCLLTSTMLAEVGTAALTRKLIQAAFTSNAPEP